MEKSLPEPSQLAYISYPLPSRQPHESRSHDFRRVRSGSVVLERCAIGALVLYEGLIFSLPTTTSYRSQTSLHRFHNPSILGSFQVYLFPPTSRGPGNKKRARVQRRSCLPTFDLATVDGDPRNLCGSRDGIRRTPIIGPAERLSLSETRLCVVSRR
jgi:hypothetical protein